MKPRTVLLGLVLVLGARSAPARPPQANAKSVDALVEEGVKLLGGGRPLEAVAVFNDLKQKAPGDPRPYFYAGIALAEAGRLSPAALELSEAVRIAPERAEYRVFQANVLARLGQRSEALDALRGLDRKEALKQVEIAWLRLLGDVYLRLDRHDAAQGVLGLLRERSPADARIEFTAGKIAVAKGELDQAAESFRKSIAASAKDPAAHFELGKVLHARNDLDAARGAFLEAVKLDPANPEYLLRLGLVCLALGRAEEALGYLQRAEPSGPARPRIYYALGNAHQALGNRARAVEYRRKFQELSQADRDREDAEREAEKVLKEGEKQLDRGNAPEARRLFEKVLALTPDNWDAHGYLAEFFLPAGELELAYEHLRAMEKIDPDSLVGNYLTARYWYGRKEYDRARVYAEKVRSFRPGHAELRNLLGHIYLGLGRADSALREYEAACQLAPERADFKNSLLELKERRPEE